MIMQLLLAAVALFAATSAQTVYHTCESENFEKLKLFNGQTQRMALPCKYWALKDQKCGKYKVTLSPTNTWTGKEYRANDMWLAVEDVDDSSKTWEGRTDNKIAVKFLNANGSGRDLFNKRDGSLSTTVLFKQGIDADGSAYVEDKGGNFRVTFHPWHPRSANNDKVKKYTHSKFKFECYHQSTLNPFPDQMCGDLTKNVIDNLSKNSQFNLKGASEDVRHRIVLYYYMLTNKDVVHMDERCQEAVDTITQNCSTFNRTLEVLKTCEEILEGNKHTKCVTTYSCHPMDVFNSCIKWGCAGQNMFDKTVGKEFCTQTGEGIDLCQDIQNTFGSLSERVEQAGCYNEFLTLKSR